MKIACHLQPRFATRFRTGPRQLRAFALALAAAGLAWMLGGAEASAAVPTVKEFSAVSYDGVSPADPDLAVGPRNIVETINTSMTVFTKLGRQTSHREFSDLFSPATNVFCADPRVIYWSWGNRYAIVCTDIGPNKTIRLAITSHGDPNGPWLTWSTGPNTAVDQPSVEVAIDKLVVGGSTSINGVSSYVFYVFQKSDLVAGATNPRVSFLSIPRGQFQAAVQFAPARDAYFVQAYPGGNDLYLATISGSPATADVRLAVADLGAYPLTAPTQPALPGGYLGGGYLDGRITSAAYAMIAGGSRIIQYSGMAECGSRVCNSSGRITLNRAGAVSTYVKILSETAWDDTYGAVTVDGAGRDFEVFSRSNETRTPEAAVATSGFQSVVAESVLGTTACQAAATPPCNERWGDYLGATQDPTSPDTVWFVGLYQTAGGHDGWTTEIASVTAA